MTARKQAAPVKQTGKNGIAKRAKAAKSAGPTPITLPQGDGRTDREAIAYAMIKPSLRHGQLAGELGQLMVARLPEEQHPGVAEYRIEVSKQIMAAQDGDLTIVSQLLAAQALSLDATFTELARRSAINLNTHVDAAERYMRMALRAQANCRATLQALADHHRPREQIIKHVTVNEGGQAVVADQFHNHKGGGPDEKRVEQSHAPADPTRERPALPGADTIGDPMPRPSRARKAKVPNARRD